MDHNSVANTDKEIWRRTPDDYYSPSIHVTENGDIGINVHGWVLVASVEKWHEAGIEAFVVPERPINRPKNYFFGEHIRDAINIIKEWVKTL
jgi:hypothetical protein